MVRVSVYHIFFKSKEDFKPLALPGSLPSHPVIIFTVPGKLILIEPPYTHISVESEVNAGFPPIRTVGLPGAQGAIVAGIQGMGVRTPMAAAVAAATIGFAILLHMPNGMILTSGTLSIMDASAVLLITLAAGSTFIGVGAAPKEHINIAPPHTHIPINILLYDFLFSSSSVLIRLPVFLK